MYINNTTKGMNSLQQSDKKSQLYLKLQLYNKLCPLFNFSQKQKTFEYTQNST